MSAGRLTGGPWEVEVTDEFHDWWLTLSEQQQESLTARVDLLIEHGPTLGRPTVDSIKGSRHPNMKEIRCSSGGALRVLFAFDPRSAAILLIGGNKAADADGPVWNDWYDDFVPIADDMLDEHIQELRTEGLI